jgi:hypothetical protein
MPLFSPFSKYLPTIYYTMVNGHVYFPYVISILFVHTIFMPALYYSVMEPPGEEGVDYMVSLQ